MHYSVLNRATIRVAGSMDISGRVTAESAKCGFCAKKQSDLARIYVLAIFGSVVLLAPMTARAQGVPAEIAALKAQVATLQSQVQALQTQLAAVQSNNALKLGPFVKVNPSPENGVKGPNITFKGANIHIVSGSGATADTLFHGGSLTGLGNLIIGYDELLPNQIANRGGSHNLVIGTANTFTSSAFGGLVAGELNTIEGAFTTVTGGLGNTADVMDASVSGGRANHASGAWATVTCGLGNTASGIGCSVSGGSDNIANAGAFDHIAAASVSGGGSNTASGSRASISGGLGNTASGTGASVIGGQNNTANIDFSIRPQPPFSP